MRIIVATVKAVLKKHRMKKNREYNRKILNNIRSLQGKEKEEYINSLLREQILDV